MLRLLFQNLEQTLGPSLSQVSWLWYSGGLTLLAFVGLVPAWRVWIEAMAVRTGMERRWVMRCPKCGKRTIVVSRMCGNCNEDLGIPLLVRLWTFTKGRGEVTVFRRFRRWIHLFGSVTFLLLSIWIVTATGGLAPQGALHRLFLGFAFGALALFGWLAGRALRIGVHGALARVGDAAMALAAIGAMAIALFLTDAARHTTDVPLARFDTTANAARIGERLLPLRQGEIGFDYLQLDQESLGYHRIIALGFSGSERVPFERNALKEWAIRHLRQHAAGYTARGFTVRSRTDRLQIVPGQSYEVIEREGQVLLRSTARG